MAFNFYGTYTSGQFEEFRKFSKIQERDLASRLKWLKVQESRNGIFVTEYDPQTFLPVSFSVSSPSSYGAKLFQAYRALGGNPEKEFLLRTTDNPVFLTKGRNISTNVGTDPTSGYSETFTNGRRIRGDQRFDRTPGLIVEKLKGWQLEAIKRKRESLEYKIKRCLDYSDQIAREILLIESMLNQDSGKTLDDLLIKISLAQSTTGAQNLVDNPEDIFGLNIGRPKDPTYAPDYDLEDSEALR